MATYALQAFKIKLKCQSQSLGQTSKDCLNAFIPKQTILYGFLMRLEMLLKS
jgi:hypothetical protein